MSCKLFGAALGRRWMGVLAAGAAAWCTAGAEPAKAEIGRYAVHFNNAAAITASPGDLPVGSGAYTIEAWIRTEVMSDGIVGWGNYGAASQVNALRLDSVGGGALHNYWWSNDLTGVTGDLTNTWHHAATTWDGATHRIYLDGVEVASRTHGVDFGTLPNVQLGNFAIGSTNFLEYFQGDIAEVRIWNVARTGAQLASDMNSQLTGGESGLVSLYRFEEGAGSTTADEAGTAFNGTLGAGLSWVDLLPPDGALSGNGSFGSVANGSSSAPQTFTISNATGTGSLIVSDVGFTGADDLLFALAPAGGNACAGTPFTLNVGESCDVAVVFAPPAGTSSGSKSASLALTSNNPSSLTAALSGSVPTIATASLLLTASSRFMATVVNATSPEATFTLTNAGSTQVNGVSASISGTDASMFAITGGTCGSSLPAGQSCTYTLTFSPTGTVTAATVMSAALDVTTSNTSANASRTFQALTGANVEQIPTLSEWGMIALGLMLAGSMFLAMRKRDDAAG